MHIPEVKFVFLRASTLSRFRLSNLAYTKNTMRIFAFMENFMTQKTDKMRVMRTKIYKMIQYGTRYN